jgi:hypothetical protein
VRPQRDIYHDVVQHCGEEPRRLVYIGLNSDPIRKKAQVGKAYQVVKSVIAVGFGHAIGSRAVHAYNWSTPGTAKVDSNGDMLSRAQ